MAAASLRGVRGAAMDALAGYGSDGDEGRVRGREGVRREGGRNKEGEQLRNEHRDNLNEPRN